MELAHTPKGTNQSFRLFLFSFVSVGFIEFLLVDGRVDDDMQPNTRNDNVESFTFVIFVMNKSRREYMSSSYSLLVSL